MKGDGFVLTLEIGGAAACGWNISLSCSTIISTENLISDCSNNSWALCLWTGVILYDLEILCLAQLCNFSAVLWSLKRARGEQQIWDLILVVELGKIVLCQVVSQYSDENVYQDLVSVTLSLEW